MRVLRAAAWAVFCFDLVILAQLGYGAATADDPALQGPVRGLTMMLGAGLLGVAFLLILGSRLHSRAGLWIALVCAAVPLLWAAGAILGSMWE